MKKGRKKVFYKENIPILNIFKNKKKVLVSDAFVLLCILIGFNCSRQDQPSKLDWYASYKIPISRNFCLEGISCKIASYQLYEVFFLEKEFCRIRIASINLFVERQYIWIKNYINFFYYALIAKSNFPWRYSLSSVRCVYWSSELRGWEGNGCNLVSTTPTHSTCTCNHLTNFAVIMDIGGIIQER